MAEFATPSDQQNLSKNYMLNSELIQLSFTTFTREPILSILFISLTNFLCFLNLPTALLINSFTAILPSPQGTKSLVSPNLTLIRTRLAIVANKSQELIIQTDITSAVASSVCRQFQS